jgi:hypothetical protein
MSKHQGWLAVMSLGDLEGWEPSIQQNLSGAGFEIE